MLFEKIFVTRPWKFLFVSSDDLIAEWRNRWSLDRYSFLIGMVFGIIICMLKKLNLVDDYENNMEQQYDEDNLDLREKRRDKTQLSIKMKSILTLIALSGIIFYYLFAVLCKSKENCDSFTTYLTFIPVNNFLLTNNIQNQTIYSKIILKKFISISN